MTELRVPNQHMTKVLEDAYRNYYQAVRHSPIDINRYRHEWIVLSSAALRDFGFTKTHVAQIEKRIENELGGVL